MTMHKYGKSNLWAGEKSELLHGPLDSYTHEQMPWFTKDRVLFTIKEKWYFESFYIKVNKILWNSEFAWFRNDNVECERVAFDMYKGRDLDDLVGYLFQASIEGYTIRYVSPDTLTGIYLQKTRDFSTNIDDEVLTTLADVVNAANEDRKPRWR
jgi:hypothetical protein